MPGLCCELRLAKGSLNRTERGQSEASFGMRVMPPLRFTTQR
jgi:hypothetical protein